VADHQVVIAGLFQITAKFRIFFFRAAAHNHIIDLRCNRPNSESAIANQNSPPHPHGDDEEPDHAKPLPESILTRFTATLRDYDNTYTLKTAGPLLVNFNYLGVDEVNFISLGGTHHSGYTGNGTQFVMDNLTVTVPEPNALSLFGICILILCWRIKPVKSRGRVKNADMKFGNDQIFDMRNLDEASRWMGWSKNEFSHKLSLEPTPVGRFSSAFAVDIAHPAWLSSRR
jgi:hypothetical protein